MSAEKPYVEWTRKEIEATYPMEKHGSSEDGTEGAHMLSHELVKGILAHTPGAKAAGDIAERLNRKENIRIKTADGNRITDRTNDAAILEKYVSKELLTQKEADRAVQAYKGGMAVCEGNATLKHIVEKIGEMRVSTGRPGQPPKVKNLVY